MHEFDKLTLAELEKFKILNDQAIAEAYLLLSNLETHERTIESYIAKKQPFNWPWQKQTPTTSGRYMCKEIGAPYETAKFCIITVSPLGAFRISFKNDHLERNRPLFSISKREWIKIPEQGVL